MYRKIKRLVRSIAITPLIFLVALYILFEDFLQTVVKPFVNYLSSLHILHTVEVFLQRRNPYTLLGIYICKLATFSGIKLFSLYLISQGNIIGGPLLVCGEMTGAILTVWYAKVALPSLMTIHRFAAFYNRIKEIKNKLIYNLKQTAIFRYAQIIREHIRALRVAIKNRTKKSLLAKAIYRFIHHKSQAKS